jgi:hypothetical protein
MPVLLSLSHYTRRASESILQLTPPLAASSLIG